MLNGAAILFLNFSALLAFLAILCLGLGFVKPIRNLFGSDMADAALVLTMVGCAGFQVLGLLLKALVGLLA